MVGVWRGLQLTGEALHKHHQAFCRGQLKCDGTCAETRFSLSAKRRSPFKSARASLYSTTGSRSVRIRGSNAGYTMFRGYPLHSPVSPSLPLPCVTVCHHVSAGFYTFHKRPQGLKLWIYSQQNKCFWRRYNAEICTLLGFYAVQNGSCVQFRDSLSLPFSKVKQSRSYDSECLTLTNGTDRLSRNVGTKQWFYAA
jgi:hypothetical protein